LRLAALLAAVTLATSRLGLLAHELVGHGGAALALGAHILEVRLFWFAGGWIHYQLPAGTVAELLAISMAGIAVELVCGLSIMVFNRKQTSLARRSIFGVGAALVLHGSWYLATGAWSGFGDGIILYRVLGDGRYPVAIAAGALTCTAAYVGARGVFGALSATVGRRAVATCIAIALAGGLHVALAVTELRVRRDQTYGQVMQPERERVVARDLERWTREQGSAVTDDARALEQKKLEAEHHTFPFAWLLAIGAGVAAILGARRSKPGDGVLPARLVAIAAGAAVLAIGAVIAIDVLTR
jgi:hypothetical protein